MRNIEGGGGGGLDAAPGAADDDPQLESEVPIPIAAIVLNIAELPTALPTAVRNSRRRMSFRSDVMPSPALSASPIFLKTSCKTVSYIKYSVLTDGFVCIMILTPDCAQNSQTGGACIQG
jgi:hypothetical protein